MEAIQTYGPLFTSVFGPDYNYVSFDPRGVGFTGPKLSCATNETTRDAYIDRRLKDTAPRPEQWAQSLALGARCTELNKDKPTKYAGTSAVVEDIMHYTDLVGASKGLAKGDALVNYIGSSYGTLLGQTLAARYPQRLGRIILDGNIYGVTHYQGSDPAAIDDLDHEFKFFFSLCHEAGEEVCPLAANSTSAGDVETRYRALLLKLEAEPVPIQGSYDIVTRSDFEALAFVQLYNPLKTSPPGFFVIATVAAELEQGITTSFTKFDEPVLGPAATESFLLITSLDVAGRYNIKNYSDFEVAVTKLQEESFYGWRYYAHRNTIIVNQVNIIPPKSQIFGAFERTNTSNPILFVGNTADHVTPLSSAFKMSEFFEKSVVLTVDAPGHTFFAVNSTCAVGHIRAYLATGVVPEVGTICPSDSKPADYFTLPATPTV